MSYTHIIKMIQEEMEILLKFLIFKTMVVQNLEAIMQSQMFDTTDNELLEVNN